MLKQSGDGRFPAWVLWVIGPVTVLAVALIILAVILGIRAGQRQIDIQRRQQVGIALQRAEDFQNEGRLQDAVAEYRRVLILDPANETALAGIQTIVSMATGEEGAPVVVAPPAVDAAATPLPAAGVSAPTPAAPVDSADEARFQQALAVYQAGRWQEAADLLVALRADAPDVHRSQVDEMLYNCYVTLAADAEQRGDLSAAVAYVDEALLLRPNSAALRQVRTLTATYVEALSLGDTNLARTVELLESIYLQDPQYRDVASRLQVALRAYGDQLALEKEWCLAEDSYTQAISIDVTDGSIARRDYLAERCDELEALIASGGVTPTPRPTLATLPTAVAAVATPVPAAADTAAASEDEAAAEDEATPEATVAPVSAGPAGGRILYSALDPVNGRSLIYLRDVASGAPPAILVENASQPAFRPDTQRLAFRNLRDDSRGISSLDPASGLTLRFTTFAEDVQPRWNAEGNLIAFASTREGDRRSRIYIQWADVGNESDGVTFGQAPSWHPGADLLAYQGCDETGNRCGIWVMNGSGGDRRGVTSVPADTRPSWASNGAFIAFMSEGRDGNAEIYQVNTASGAVTRLTNDPALDVSPSVSPDGAWVAFFSNRGGAWGVWAVPAQGGDAQLLFPVEGGIGNWGDHQLHWVN